MALRDILILPDPRLRLVSEPVKMINGETRQLVEDMFETMYAAPGIGLAAIQVGVPARVVTLDLAKKDEPPQRQVFINPEITWQSEEKGSYEEGCLSIPDYYEEVERPARVIFCFGDRGETIVGSRRARRDCQRPGRAGGRLGLCGNRSAAAAGSSRHAAGNSCRRLSDAASGRGSRFSRSASCASERVCNSNPAAAAFPIQVAVGMRPA